MGGPLRHAIAIAGVFFAVHAEGAPRLSLAMKGDKGAVVSKQLAAELCSAYECVPRAKVFTGPKPNFARAKALGVRGILMGTVSKKGGARTVSLALFTRPSRPAITWKFPLNSKGRLTQGSLDRLMGDLQARYSQIPPRTDRGVAAPPPAPAPAPQPAPPASVPPPAFQPSEPPPSAPPPVEQAAEPAPSPAEVSRREARQWLLAVELGYQGTRRDLSYEGTGSGANDLLAYRVSLVSSPRLHLELFPLASSTQGALAGLGLFGDYAFSVGLETQNGSGTKQPSSYSRIQAGATWRIYPSATSRLALVPAVSYQRMRFTVDGGIPGLPNMVLTGIKGSLGFELPVGGGFTVLAGGGYVHWMSAKDLVEDFFRSGSAYALEAEAGVSLAFTKAISLRVLGEYSLTKYSLSDPSTSTYVATGARDEYISARAMLRWQY